MKLQLNPLTAVFAAEAYGIDLRKPLDAGAAREIETAMDRYGVLVWRNQPLDEDQQIAFARNFGPLDAGLRKAYKGAANRFSYDELLDISNVDASGKIAARDSLKNISNVANQLWHSDSSFQKPAAKYSILSGVVVPPKGGETEYADLRAAYDALPGEMKELIAGLSAQHFAFHTRMMLGDNSYTPEQLAVFPPVEWPLVRVHPGSKRKLLFVGVHCTHVPGMTLAEGKLLISDLLEHATQREFVYRHTWAVGDVVMWDNRCTLHRGRRFDLSQRRELRRTTTEEVGAEAVRAA